MANAKSPCDGRANGGSVYAPRQPFKIEIQQPETSAVTRIVYPDEVATSTGLREGAVMEVLVNSYERNPVAHQQCHDRDQRQRNRGDGQRDRSPAVILGEAGEDRQKDQLAGGGARPSICR